MKTTTSLLTFFILVVNSIAEEKEPIKKAMNTFIDEGVLSGAVSRADRQALISPCDQAAPIRLQCVTK